MPATPARMRTASDRAHTATTGRTWARCRPLRSTNAFCAPMATMRESPTPNPVRVDWAAASEVMMETLGELAD